MSAFSLISKSSQKTLEWGKKLSQILKKGDIVCLYGELGSGKTTFTKGIAEGLKINPKAVNSPTFVLLNEYHGRLPLYHFDLYRLEDPQEILGIGYEEFLYGEGISVVEWADRLKMLLPKNFLRVELGIKGENERLIKFSSRNRRGLEIIRRLKR